MAETVRNDVNEVGELAGAWERESWVMETLTPIWGGGVSSGKCAETLKGTTLMGSLRYWVEQACREEGSRPCSGSDWCGKETCVVCGVFGSTERARAFRMEVRGLNYAEEDGGFWGLKFVLTVRTRRGHKEGEAARERIGKAIELIAKKGGLGARTQHGYGQVALLGSGSGGGVDAGGGNR